MKGLRQDEYVLKLGDSVIAVAYNGDDLELVKSIVGAANPGYEVYRYENLDDALQEDADEASRITECPRCGRFAETWYHPIQSPECAESWGVPEKQKKRSEQ